MNILQALNDASQSVRKVAQEGIKSMRSIKGKKAGNAQPISDENAAPNSKSSTPKAVKSVTPKRKSSVKKQRSAKKSIIEEIPHTDFIGHASPCAMDMEEDEIVEESVEDGEEEEMPRQAMPTPVRKSIETLRKATPKKSAKKSAKKSTKKSTQKTTRKRKKGKKKRRKRILGFLNF